MTGVPAGAQGGWRWGASPHPTSVLLSDRAKKVVAHQGVRLQSLPCPVLAAPNACEFLQSTMSVPGACYADAAPKVRRAKCRPAQRLSCHGTMDAPPSYQRYNLVCGDAPCGVAKDCFAELVLSCGLDKVCRCACAHLVWSQLP